jgi:acyl phosphate:glycerol-3-phosphate acyltransferase
MGGCNTGSRRSIPAGDERRHVSDGLFVALAAIPAYLLGTFPTAILVARAGGHDVLAEGSGNPGASNVARLMGWKAGLLVMAGDLAKGAIAAGVGLAVAGRGAGYILGILAVIGHTYPVTRRFKGGKGVATAGGMLAVLNPVVVAVLAVVWFVTARVLKLASVGSIIVAVLFPIGVWLTGRAGWEIAITTALAVLVIARHLPNLRRLVRGQELRTDGASPP